MRGTKQNIKWDSLISFAWFSCQYVAEKLRYTRNLNQNIISEREKNPKLKCYLSEASLSIRDFFFALLESHGKFFKGLYRVGWHMIYPFHWRLVKAGVDSWEKRLMGRAEKAGVEYICWQSNCFFRFQSSCFQNLLYFFVLNNDSSYPPVILIIWFSTRLFYTFSFQIIRFGLL